MRYRQGMWRSGILIFTGLLFHLYGIGHAQQGTPQTKQEPGKPLATETKPATTIKPNGETKAPGQSTSSPAASEGKPTKPTTPTATIQLKRDISGDFSYRFLPAKGVSTAPAPLPAPAGSDGVIALALPAGMKREGAVLEVVDGGRGNVAHLLVETPGVLSLSESSFQYVQMLSVPVQIKGKAVYGALVTVADAEKHYSKEWMLKQSDGGIAQFLNVPLKREVTVTVTYSGYPPISQKKTLGLDHPADGAHWQTVEVDWADVKTTSVPTPSPASATSPVATPTARPELAPISGAVPAAQPAPAESSGGFLNGTASLIVNLVILGGCAYGLFWAYQTGRIKTLLERLNIETSPLPTAGTPVPNPFLQAERTPIQPITEGTADPLAGGGMGRMPTAPPIAVSTGPRLVATLGTYLGNVFPLLGASVDIGRDATNGVALPQDTNASRRHATILLDNGQYMLIDHGSSNGTFHNGVRLSSQTPQQLRTGDEVQIGMTRFRFEV